ncbi:MAG: SDR family oxidoreductase [Phycisphaera sp.]|nr:SDR family oxidoreductase [Phycisphaera sp.]
MELQGKAAIVTGAGTGVGRAAALRLARLGCSVAINYNRSADDAEAAAAEARSLGVGAIAVQADVSNDADARALVDTAMAAFGRLDVLVNNAGTTAFIPFNDLDAVTDDVWQRLMAVNVAGPFYCARAAAKAMRITAEQDGVDATGGEIVNVGSVAGLLATGSSIPYCASKAALHNMTVALARTLAPTIRVNAVAPGFITGRWLREGLAAQYDRIKAAFENAMPLQRVCEPDDVAAAILSLITGPDLVTGHVHVIDAGMSILSPINI